MKKRIKSYLSFTRTEKIGLVCLCGLLVILIGVRATMHVWIHPADDADRNRKLVAAWEVFKRSQPAKADTGTAERVRNDYEDAYDENTTPLPKFIDLNTADSATLVRLKGIGPVTAGKIIARRRNKGLFTNIDQLSEVGHFPKNTFDLLKKHLVIK